MFCEHLNKHGIELDVNRISPGNYTFGSRNINTKILNDKLLIRVGGGYMSADEFIEHYGQIEMLKIMPQEEVELFKDLDQSDDMGDHHAQHRGHKDHHVDGHIYDHFNQDRHKSEALKIA